MAGALLSTGYAHAQDTAGTDVLAPEQIAAQIKPLHPKTLVMVFDVSASTQANGVFRREREASATLIREGCSPGDRVVLEAFDTGFKTVFDKTLGATADMSALVDDLPASVETGHGTNIRWPHHEALKRINSDLPHPGVVVLLTDSFNDQPLTSDPNYPKYRDYYTLGNLTRYPDTADNRDYERLLRKLQSGGKLRQYGVGVGLAPSGRPIERLPLGPGQGDPDAGNAAQTPTVLTPIGQEKPASNLPALLAALGLLLLAILGAGFALLNRPVPVRLTLGDRGTPRDYRLRRGGKIGLGGALTSAAPGDDVFPLGGVTAPLAFVRAGRGAADLVPAPSLPPGVALFHNGVKLESPAPLRVGDEIRATLPATDAAPAREHRIHFADPRAPAF